MMRSLTVELFKFIYTITNAALASYYISLLLISVLDVCILQGISLLLMYMLPTKMIMIIFKIPFVFATGTVLFFLNLKLTDKKILEIADVIRTKYTKIILYTASALLLVVYSSLVGKLF